MADPENPNGEGPLVDGSMSQQPAVQPYRHLAVVTPDRAPVYCSECRWCEKNMELMPTAPWYCYSVVAAHSFSGPAKRYCSSLNTDGFCPDFERFYPWWTRLWSWAMGTR